MKCFWRAHPYERPFSPEDAWSNEWYAPEQFKARGYSSLESPSDLFGYFNPTERVNSYIVCFTGEQVGTGADSEPLVVPDMKYVVRMDWWDLEDRVVGSDVVADIDRRNGWESLTGLNL